MSNEIYVYHIREGKLKKALRLAYNNYTLMGK